MVDYPYPTTFLAPLPAWPVNYACQQVSSALAHHPNDPRGILYGMSAGAEVFFNYAHQESCLKLGDGGESGIDASGWNILYCNEMPMPFASSAETSMFPPYEWDQAANTAFCQYEYDETPQYDWVFNYFGGLNIKKDFAKLTNVVFSNGSLDPWHAGGILETINDSCTTLYIENSAHHLDLREPNAADPVSLTEAREIETQQIAKWIDQYQGTNFSATVSPII